MLLSDWLRQAQERLERAGVESARLEAQLLAAHGLGQYRSWVLAHPEAPTSDSELEGPLERREMREPLAYILGCREFFGRRFTVTPAVLIPRQETETLVEAALEHLKPGDRILDLGTGSGCIAISIALALPDVEVWASDQSVAALLVAERNAHALGARVQFVHSDLFNGLGNEAFGLIVSNPPYVQTGADLQPEVRDWEPSLALFAGDDGLDFYRRIAKSAQNSLVAGGSLLLEVGDDRADSVSQLFQAHGWERFLSKRDLSGTDRVIGVRSIQVDDCGT